MAWIGELLRRPLHLGPRTTQANSGPSQWAGRTDIASGSTTATVSTRMVNSDSIIKLSLQGDGTDAASGQFVGVEVKSIESGSYFTVGYADGQAQVFDRTVMWELLRTSE